MSAQRHRITRPDPFVDPIVEWTPHAIDRWEERGDDRGHLRAFAESQEIDYPSAHSGCRGRYHAESDVVLIVARERRLEASIGWEIFDVVVTVIELGDREEDEQEFVREQVEE